MDILLHDVTDIERFLKINPDEMKVISDNGRIKPCICCYGCYSPFVKNVLDRSVSYLLPYLKTKNRCTHCGIHFGGGIGQGAGEMIKATKVLPLYIGPFNNLHRALKSMAKKIELRESFDIIYLSPYLPRFLWRLLAIYTSWHPLAYKNGLKKDDIRMRIFEQIEI